MLEHWNRRFESFREHDALTEDALVATDGTNGLKRLHAKMTDTGQDWYVKYGTLSINYMYANGDKKQVEWEYDPWESDDYKWGAGEYDKGKIENADEHGVQYSDDEEEEDDNDSD